MPKRSPQMPLDWRYDRLVEQFYLWAYPIGPLYLMTIAWWLAVIVAALATSHIRFGS